LAITVCPSLPVTFYFQVSNRTNMTAEQSSSPAVAAEPGSRKGSNASQHGKSSTYCYQPLYYHHPPPTAISRYTTIILHLLLSAVILPSSSTYCYQPLYYHHPPPTAISGYTTIILHLLLSTLPIIHIYISLSWLGVKCNVLIILYSLL